MSHEITQFKFNGFNIRSFMKDGEVFFVGKDVAEVLGYTNPSKSINDHCKSLKTLKSNESLLLGFDIPPRGGDSRTRRVPSHHAVETTICGEV